MDIPEIPNVSKSAVAYLLQAALELAAEAEFEPTNEDHMREWANQNCQAIAERAELLQLESFSVMQQHYNAIAKIMGADMWGKVRRADIDDALD
jgi:hypothetical protein